MSEALTPFYAPALRLKKGERDGLSDLSPDIASRVLPRFIVPPRSDRDDELQSKLFAEQDFPAVGAVLADCWSNRPALIDFTYLIGDFGHYTAVDWLPKMFADAQRFSVLATPMVDLRDIENLHSALKLATAFAPELKLAIRIPSGIMVGSEWKNNLLGGLQKIDLAPQSCCVVADFFDADFSQPDLVAAVIQAALEDLQEVGRWKHIIFQGTNFPEVNPAPIASSKLVERNEWHAWRQAVNYDPSTAEHLIFGDYAADSAKMLFGGSGGRAIRHYRYATSSSWLIQRGAKAGSDTQIMRTVCQNIVNSGHFAGRSFSAADDYIFLTSRGLAGPGNSTTWRAVNTTHHLTRAVVDIGAVREVQFDRRKVAEISMQQGLFFSEEVLK